jgi:hypothetical protein
MTQQSKVSRRLLSLDLQLLGDQRNLKWIVWIFRGMCFLVIVGGIAIGMRTHEVEWVNRSGDVLVAMSLILTFAQFVYERQQAPLIAAAVQRAGELMKKRELIPGEYAETLLKVRLEATERYETMRFYILLNTLIVAAAGELISAFGGVLLHLTMANS